MKASEFIEKIREQCGGDDPEVAFESYEWTDDLEELQYLPRDFEGVEKKDGFLVITVSR